MFQLKSNKKRPFAVLFFAAVVLVVFLVQKEANAPESGQSPNQNSVAGELHKQKYSTTDPKSIWVIVNKKQPLPDGFAPTDLKGDMRKVASGSLQALLDAAKSAKQPLSIISGFRSQESQTLTYGSVVHSVGQAEADKQSARPGYSEHQTGLAIDLGNGTCDLEACFGDTAAGKWLATHAHEYGFVIRYQKGKESLTGYQYEPWHLRYVGNELASELYKSGQTMEQFFNLPAAPSY